MIFLIGMPGVGKSYWGKYIARLYNKTFIDLDTIIEEYYQKSIADLIAEGEDLFRAKESERLKAFSNHKDVILACGGGTPCFYDNIAWMLENGTVIWLRDDISNIAIRLSQDTNKRPLLQGNQALEEKLQDLLSKRIGFYQRATIHLDVNQPTCLKFVTEDLGSYFNQ